MRDGSEVDLCSGNLSEDGTGNCHLTAEELPPGSYAFTAHYAGILGQFNHSDSAPHPVTIQKRPTVTTLSLAPSRVQFSQQQNAELSFTVAPAIGAGTPGGQVTIHEGNATICGATLDNGTATCKLRSSQLDINFHNLTATYGGDTDFASSDSVPALLQVERDVATLSLTLSPTSVTFGRENSEMVSVTATGVPGGTPPSGTVFIITSAGGQVCSLQLADGQGSCPPIAATSLLPGRYQMTASYNGDVNYQPTTFTDPTPLTVTAEHTSTALTLSRARVKFGNERAEKLTVKVKPAISGTGTPDGTVTIKAGNRTLCSAIRLKDGTASCSLTARKLRPGTYHLTARYAGVRPFASSVSGRKTLTITR